MYDEDGNEIIDDLQMELETEVRTSEANLVTKGNYVNGTWVNYEDLLKILLETYQKSCAIGWETKALDELTTKLRQL